MYKFRNVICFMIYTHFEISECAMRQTYLHWLNVLLFLILHSSVIIFFNSLSRKTSQMSINMTHSCWIWHLINISQCFFLKKCATLCHILMYVSLKVLYFFPEVAGKYEHLLGTVLNNYEVHILLRTISNWSYFNFHSTTFMWLKN